MKHTLFFGMCLICLLMISEARARRLETESKSFDVSRINLLELKIEIDVSTLLIEKHSKPGIIDVAAAYDEDKYTLDTEFDKADETLVIKFDREGFWEKKQHREENADLEIFLPDAVEIELKISMKVGVAKMNLGGLKLAGVRCKNWIGEIDIAFDEPNHCKMEYFDLNNKIGSTKIKKLGNARFIDADINSGTGELEVDFRGALETPSKANLDLDIGETTVILPRDFGIELSFSKLWFLSEVSIPREFKESGRRYRNREFKKYSKGLRINVDQGIGSLDFDVR
ncbi:hypothetical protein JXJ21_10870 [candidate division KSB1 bacterium]|nr:hypothetical protein [candidate division KSB1 bacterium]